MAQQNQPQPSNAEAAQEGTEGDALDELDAALGHDTENPDQDGQGGEEWKPPTREQWEAAQAALEAERAKLKRARTQAKNLREQRQQTTTAAQTQGDGGDGQGAPGPDPQLTVWQQRAVRTAAKAELLARGADPDMVDLAVSRLKPDQIDFNDDDEPELEEWLDEMQDKYPKLFAKPEPAPAPTGARRAMGAVDQGSARGRPVGRQMSYGERVIENSRRAMQGQAGRRGN